jgi:hypothetical protein
MSAFVALLAAQWISRSGGALISGALIGGWKIGVTMDEIPFAVDAAIDVHHANRHRGGSISYRAARLNGVGLESTTNPTPAPNLHARAREHGAVTGTGT